MFDFFSMMNNYEERVVDNYDKDGVVIDTALVTDSGKPYETAISHPDYHDNKMIIVELYDTKEEAQSGHNKWVKIMTSENLPLTIKDVSTAGIAQLCHTLDGGEEWIYEKEIKEKTI